MKKKFIMFLLSAMILALGVVSVNANEVPIMLDGEHIDVVGVIVDDRTLVPARGIVESLGGTIEWNSELRQVSIDGADGIHILLTIDSADAIVNDATVELDVPAQIIDGSTMIPVRFVAENLGVNVDFVGGAVIITTVQTQINQPQVAQVPPPTQQIEIPPIAQTSVGTIISVPNQARRNEVLTLTFQGEPNTQYTLDIVSAANNPLTADGLGSTISDSNGIASWTWLVGGRTGAGTQRLTISGDGIIVTHNLVIIVD